MKIDKNKLLSIAVKENPEEQALANDLRDNHSLYKTSMRIALKIKRALKEIGITQNQLALKMKVDPAAMSRFLSGKSNLELKTILRFEEELGINIINRSISPFSDAQGNPISLKQQKCDGVYFLSSQLLTLTNKSKEYKEIINASETDDIVNEEAMTYSLSSPEDANLKIYNEGKVEGLRESARNMLKANLDPNFIHEITGLPIDEIQSLK